MPTFYTSSNVKKNGPMHMKNNANLIALVKNPNKADNWATFQSKIIGQAAITGADIAIVDEGNDVKITINGKAGIDPNAAALQTDDICLAVCITGTEEVCLVNDANDRDIDNNPDDTIDIPANIYYIRELVAAP